VYARTSDFRLQKNERRIINRLIIYCSPRKRNKFDIKQRMSAPDITRYFRDLEVVIMYFSRKKNRLILSARDADAEEWDLWFSWDAVIDVLRDIQKRSAQALRDSTDANLLLDAFPAELKSFSDESISFMTRPQAIAIMRSISRVISQLAFKAALSEPFSDESVKFEKVLSELLSASNLIEIAQREQGGTVPTGVSLESNVTPMQFNILKAIEMDAVRDSGYQDPTESDHARWIQDISTDINLTEGTNWTSLSPLAAAAYRRKALARIAVDNTEKAMGRPRRTPRTKQELLFQNNPPAVMETSSETRTSLPTSMKPAAVGTGTATKAQTYFSTLPNPSAPPAAATPKPSFFSTAPAFSTSTTTVATPKPSFSFSTFSSAPTTVTTSTSTTSATPSAFASLKPVFGTTQTAPAQGKTPPVWA
jgi:hypothetical protein